MLRIGFTNKYFTLWDVSSSTNYGTDANGKHYPMSITTSYTYYQNLSMDEGKAIEKAKIKGVTELDVDSDLRGVHRSWERTKQIEYDYEDYQFRFGKYDKEDIRKCPDSDYIKWYYGETKNEIAMNRLVELDDNYVVFEGELLTQEQNENRLLRGSRISQMKKDGFIDVFVERNIDYDGMINISGIEFIFEERNACYYAGFEYYIPKINGKGKRIKNKVCRFYTEPVVINGWDMWKVTKVDIIKK